MPVLKSLTLAALPKAATDPVHTRWSKLISRLEEQKSLIADPALLRKVLGGVAIPSERLQTPTISGRNGNNDARAHQPNSHTASPAGIPVGDSHDRF